MSVPSVAGARLLDTSERTTAFVLPTERGMVRLSPAALRLLRDVEAGRSWDEIAAGATRSDGTRVTPEDVRTAYQGLAEKLALADERSGVARGGMWARLPLLPKGRVGPIARLLAGLYHPVAVGLGLVLIAVGVSLLLPAALGPSAAPGSFWPGFVLFLAALACHELGHASATARYGAEPGEIGFVMYMVFPAFYSNVTSAWTLRRWQRVVVDVGGVYFELLFASVLALVYAVHPWEPLRTTFVLVLGSVLFTLNPILKFDGYWVLADALGVTNLGRQPVVVAHVLWEWSRGRPATLPWPAPVAALVGLYSVVAVGVFGWFFARLAPFLAGAARSWPTLARGVAEDLAGGSWPDQLGALITATYMLVFVGLVLWRWVRRGGGWLARRLGVAHAGTAG